MEAGKQLKRDLTHAASGKGFDYNILRPEREIAAKGDQEVRRDAWRAGKGVEGEQAKAVLPRNPAPHSTTRSATGTVAAQAASWHEETAEVVTGAGEQAGTVLKQRC